MPSPIVYIAGPVTGIANHNKSAFLIAALELHKMHFETVNPMALHEHTDRPWEFYMKAALKAMLDCDMVYLLRGWENSRGATIERDLAVQLKMGLIYEEDFFPEVVTATESGAA